jgi:hypothetical protein
MRNASLAYTRPLMLAAIMAAATMPACSNAGSASEVFAGTFDEGIYQRYYTGMPEAEVREQCAALSLTRGDLMKLVETYDQVTAYHANYVLVVTPCLVEGETMFEGRKASFRWYPSGYLVFYYPGESDAEPDYFICKGSLDDEGIFECDERTEWPPPAH